MKVRVTVVEADDVSSEEVALILGRVFGLQPTPHLQSLAAVESAPTGATLPAAAEPARHQLADLGKGWRPKARTRRSESASGPGPSEGSKGPRPATDEQFMCGGCGEAREEGKDGRARCPKCHARNWEHVPARQDVARHAA